MSRDTRKNKVKVRRFWPKNPETQIHKDVKNDYNRAQAKNEWEKEVEDVLFGDELDDFTDFDDYLG